MGVEQNRPIVLGRRAYLVSDFTSNKRDSDEHTHTLRVNKKQHFLNCKTLQGVYRFE